MFALGNATFACGVRSARERSFEEASGETEVGRGLLASEPRPLPPLAPLTRPRHANRPPSWTSDLRGRYFFLKLDSSCCYARYSCGNNCNVVVKLVQECKFSWLTLLPFYGNSSPGMTHFLRKQTVTSERSR